MAKATKTIKKAKAIPKPRANKYDEKLVINGTLDELVKELLTPKSVKKK